MTTPPTDGSGHEWTTPEQPGGATGWGPAPQQPGNGPGGWQPTAPGSEPGPAPWQGPGQGPGPQGQVPPGGSGWGQLAGQQPQPYGSVISRRGIIALKPLGFGDFFDGAFRAIRHNPRAMIGLSAIVLGIINLLTAIPLIGFTTALDLGDPDALPTDADLVTAGASLLALIPVGFLQAVGLVVLTGMLMLSVTQSVVDRKLGIGELWSRARGRVLPLIGWSLLQSLGGGLLLGLAAAPGVFLLVAEEYVGGAVTLVLLLAAAGVLALWLWVMLTFVPVLIVVERLGILASLKRSFELVRGAFWRTLLVLVLASVLTQVVTGVLSTPFSFIGSFGLVMAESQPLLGAVVYALSVAVGAAVATVIAFPFFAAVVALLYVDRRIRREGLDVTLARTMADEQA